ncbi:MAG: glycosyltransferase [Gammaproteobacteria bacterium]|jgi:hypothetical protein|nr:glycosyltransferase [Gammaproteobacteria bacterium]
MQLSVIVPTRCCDEHVARHLALTRRRLPDAQLIVVEPDSEPDSDPEPGQEPEPRTDIRQAPTPASTQQPPERNAAITRALSHTSTTLTQGPRGRGTQCNAGAKRATGELLLFLHDDTQLPDAAGSIIARAFESGETEIACFQLAFDSPHPLLRFYASFSAIDSFLTSFGDQGILIRRELFDRLGGFPDWPLFEDVELLRRARRQTRVRKLPAAVTTSAVRFIDRGIVRQQLLNAELMLRFAFGADPESLRRRYERRCT